jgi:ATP-dependent Clp protease protease subunit
LYEIISEKSGQTYSKVEKDGDRDYWLSAIEAKKYGMIDDILIKRP